jgi:Sel1 repeat
MRRKSHAVTLLLLFALLQFLALSCSNAAELKRSETDSYTCYTTADQIRMSQDLKYGGVNSIFYLSSEEISDLEQKVANGDGDAALRLSQYYDMVLFDDDKGFIWLKKAAERGNVAAQYNLGVTYLHDRTRRNNEQAQIWLRKAADAGNLNARIELGRKFSREEIDKLSQESEEGNVKSALVLYSYYKKVEKDEARAKYWYMRWQEIMHKQP